jgi:hypothetical protein
LAFPVILIALTRHIADENVCQLVQSYHEVDLCSAILFFFFFKKNHKFQKKIISQKRKKIISPANDLPP